MTTRPSDDLGPWHHGDSNDVECEDGCGRLFIDIADQRALRLARSHARITRHAVEISRTHYRIVYPPQEPTP